MIVKRLPELHPVPVHSSWFLVAIDFVGPVNVIFCPEGRNMIAIFGPDKT